MILLFPAGEGQQTHISSAVYAHSISNQYKIVDILSTSL